MMSFIITTYNRSKLLEQLLASIESQTSLDWEVLIGDDHSSDPKTQYISWDFVHRHPEKAIYYNSGVKDEDRANTTRYSVLINALFPISHGDLIMCTCDDSEYAPQLVEKVRTFFKDHPRVNAGYVGRRVVYTDEESKKLANAPFNPLYGRVVPKASQIVDHSEAVIRRQFFIPWPESPDYWQKADARFFEELALKVGNFHPTGDVINDPMLLYKITSTSVIRQPVEEALRKLRDNR
jgi:spore maturation protein CgeD